MPQVCHMWGSFKLYSSKVCPISLPGLKRLLFKVFGWKVEVSVGVNEQFRN